QHGRASLPCCGTSPSCRSTAICPLGAGPSAARGGRAPDRGGRRRLGLGQLQRRIRSLSPDRSRLRAQLLPAAGRWLCCPRLLSAASGLCASAGLLRPRARILRTTCLLRARLPVCSLRALLRAAWL